jgi:hypothetical protein
MCREVGIPREGIGKAPAQKRAGASFAFYSKTAQELNPVPFFFLQTQTPPKRVGLRRG